MLLEVEALDVRYGRNRAVKSVSLEVGEPPVLQAKQHRQGQEDSEHPGPQHATAAEHAVFDRP